MTSHCHQKSDHPDLEHVDLSTRFVAGPDGAVDRGESAMRPVLIVPNHSKPDRRTRFNYLFRRRFGEFDCGFDAVAI
jgi:hypothetical protein